MVSTGIWKKDKRVVVAKQRKKWQLNINANEDNLAFAA
jgi:hypothetical protein